MDYLIDSKLNDNVVVVKGQFNKLSELLNTVWPQRDVDYKSDH